MIRSVLNTNIPDVKVIIMKSIVDSRGNFQEVYNKHEFDEAGINFQPVQINTSFNYKNSMRGFHYQLAPLQGRIIFCISGMAFFVAVDMRKDSGTYLRYVSLSAPASDFCALYAPAGFAWALLALSDCNIMYYMDTLYNDVSKIRLVWDDPDIGVEWPIENKNMIISHEDKTMSSRFCKI